MVEYKDTISIGGRSMVNYQNEENESRGIIDELLSLRSGCSGMMDQRRGADARASIAAGKRLERNPRPFLEVSAGSTRMIEFGRAQVGSVTVC